MMYNNKLAMAVKVNGKVLREFKEGDNFKTYLPFGAEYSIYIKNLNNVRALVSISIDGEDVADGDQYVVNANSTLEIERFMRSGNLNEGNRFKFIERTGAVEEHRGIDLEDGLVRIEYSFEKPRPRVRWNEYDTILRSGPSFDVYGGGSHTITTNSASYNADAPEATYTADVASAYVNQVQEQPANEVGITVEGSVSDQQFQNVSWFPTEEVSHVMVLQLFGQTKDNVQVKKAVTVKKRPRCKTCNHLNKATAKFCTECGTGLQIVA
jgi:hypothetical protein